MGELIIPGVTENTEPEEPVVAEVDEDWELLATIIQQVEEFDPEASDREKELHVELALTRHVNQQKIKSYSQLNEVNPQMFVDPLTLFSIRLDYLIDRLVGTDGEKRLEFELGNERLVTEHIDAMGMNVARQRAQMMDPNTQAQMQGFNRQQRRQQEREMAKAFAQRINQRRGQ